MSQLTNIGVAGLAVMGENLVLNMESKGFSVSVFNRTSSKTDDFLPVTLPMTATTRLTCKAPEAD